MTALYNLKSNSKGWIITKFDADLNPDTSYQMIHMDGVLNCSCPQMAKPKCRHRTMFPEFQLKQRIDTNWFFDYDTRQWRQYLSAETDVEPKNEGTYKADHTLYKTGDADAPPQIKDRNGEVVLDLCRVCGKGEAELDQPCIQTMTEAELIKSLEDQGLIPSEPPADEQPLTPAGGQAGGEVHTTATPPAQPFKRRV